MSQPPDTDKGRISPRERNEPYLRHSGSPSKRSANLDSKLEHVKEEPSTTQKEGDQEDFQQDHRPEFQSFDYEPSLLEAVSRILGIKITNWPFSNDSLQDIITLRSEQEKTKHEEMRFKSLALSIELLNVAKSMAVPPDMIPFLFTAPSPIEMREKLQTMTEYREERQRHQFHHRRDSSQSIYSQKGHSSPAPSSFQHPQLSQAQQYQYQTPHQQSRYPTLPISVPPHLSPTSSKAGLESGASPSSDLQQQKRQGSPVRGGGHQRSHTTTSVPSMASSTSVWKVNLPQQQQFQFHHWSGPRSKDSGSTSSHSNTGTSTSGILGSRSPNTSPVLVSKRKFSDSGPPSSLEKVRPFTKHESGSSISGSQQHVLQLPPLSPSKSKPLQTHEQGRSESSTDTPILGSPYSYRDAHGANVYYPSPGGPPAPKPPQFARFATPSHSQQVTPHNYQQQPQQQQQQQLQPPPPPPYYTSAYSSQQAYSFPPQPSQVSHQQQQQIQQAASGSLQSLQQKLPPLRQPTKGSVGPPPQEDPSKSKFLINTLKNPPK